MRRRSIVLIAALSFAGVACSSTTSRASSATTSTSTTATTTTTRSSPSTASATTGAPSASTVAGTGTTVPAEAASALTVLGIAPSSPEYACVAGKIDLAKIDLNADTPPIAFYRAVLLCAPAALEKGLTSTFADVLPKATADQVRCVTQGVVKAMPEADDATLTAAVAGKQFGDLPEAFRGKVLAGVKDCGIPLDVLVKAWNNT